MQIKYSDEGDEVLTCPDPDTAQGQGQQRKKQQVGDAVAYPRHYIEYIHFSVDPAHSAYHGDMPVFCDSLKGEWECDFSANFLHPTSARELQQWAGVRSTSQDGWTRAHGTVTSEHCRMFLL